MHKDTLVQEKQRAAELLETVLNSEISAESAREQWPVNDSISDDILQKAYHFLFHFEDDTTIRAKDDKYRRWQLGEGKKLIVRLRSRVSE